MKRRKKRINKKAFFFWSGGIVFLVLLSLIVKIYGGIRSSFLRETGRVNFLVFNNKNEIFLISLEGRNGWLVKLPAEKKVAVPFGFGEYELSQVFSLGEIEKKGGFLLKETIQENFSLPVFGYFHDAEGDFAESQPKEKLRLVFWRVLRGNLQSDFNKFDLLILFIRLQRIEKEFFKIRDFSGSIENVSDSKIKKEALSLAVLNSTEHLGLAQRVARLLENGGARVIMISDAQKREKDCLILSREEKKRYTSDWLKLIYHCRVELDENESNRADIILIIGEDYWKKLNEKW